MPPRPIPRAQNPDTLPSEQHPIHRCPLPPPFTLVHPPAFVVHPVPVECPGARIYSHGVFPKGGKQFFQRGIGVLQEALRPLLHLLQHKADALLRARASKLRTNALVHGNIASTTMPILLLLHLLLLHLLLL